MVTRVLLPVMRAQCAPSSGLIITITSTAAIAGQAFSSAYAASKFAAEGWIESLTAEVEPFGIRTMLVEPGYFRTDLLTPESTTYAEHSIDDAERTAQIIAGRKHMNGQRPSDPGDVRKIA